MEKGSRLNGPSTPTERPDAAIEESTPAKAHCSGNVETSGKSTEKRNWTSFIVEVLKEQWFLITLGILIAITSQVQVPLGQQELKRTVTSYVCISLIFFT